MNFKEILYGKIDKTKKKLQGYGENIREMGTDVSETASAIGSGLKSRWNNANESASAYNRGEQSFAETAAQITGQGVAAPFDAVGSAIVGAGKTLLPQEKEDKVAKTFKDILNPVVNSAPVQYLAKKYQEADDRTKRNVGAVGNLGDVASNFTPLPFVGMAVRRGFETGAKEAIGTGVKEAVESGLKKGALQLRTMTPKTLEELPDFGTSGDRLHQIYGEMEKALDPQMREGVIDEDTGEYIRMSKREVMAEVDNRLDKIRRKYTPEEFEIARRWGLEFELEKRGLIPKGTHYDEMPKYMTVYRGSNEKYLPTEAPQNFSMSKEVAQKFAGKDGVVSAFSIDKKDLPFIHNNWNLQEGEIVLPNPKSVLQLPTEKSVTGKVERVVTGNTKENIDGEYLYHTTGNRSVESIRQVGLTPGIGQYGRGVYFAPTEDFTKGYGGPDEVMLRVKRSNLENLDGFPEQEWTDSTVNPRMIEIKTSRGWEPLVKKGFTQKDVLDALKAGYKEGDTVTLKKGKIRKRQN